MEEDSVKMHRMRIVVIAGLATLAAGTQMVPAKAQSAGGDAARGRKVFARCGACHAVAPGANRLGPSLAGVMGRKAGSVPGFKYSPAMKGSKVVWNDRSMDAFLVKPATNLPGTKMNFAGLANPADRANVIAYLNTVR